MKSLDPGRVSKLDLEQVAYHEAAHATVARHFGLSAWPVIWPNPSSLEWKRERLWRGQCYIDPHPSGREASMIALAGELAIVLLRDDPGMTAREVITWLEDGAIEFSESDSSLAGDFGLAEIEEALCLVHGLWSEIEDLARELREAAGE